MFMYRKAKKAGVIVEHKSGRTVFQSISHHFIQFDGRCHCMCWLQVRLTTFQSSA
jgi:hypothetical protein